MIKANIDSALLSISIDRTLKRPLQAQLCDEIRRLAHERRLNSNDQLPPSRVLARDLSVSRITVTSAYDQLISEGYLIGRRGSGVFIADDLTGITPPPRPQSDRSKSSIPQPEPLVAFESSSPDQGSFPFHEWARLHDQVWRSPDPALLGKQDVLGWGPLRMAIAGHLRDWRGITCDPAQIVITSGLPDSIELIIRAMLEPGDRVVVEDPGHAALRNSVSQNHLTCVPGPVDSDGLVVETLDRAIRAVAVTPTRQFPLGMTMPLARRLHLLAWASDVNGIIIEDDYDGEYRYRGQPLPAMMSLDRGARVFYVGSFSKVLFPGIRLAFMVVPQPHLPSIQAEMRSIGPRAALVSQPVLARFIESGRFATHIRRMRRLYAHRQSVLLREIETHCGGLLHAEPESGGMHLVAGMTPALLSRLSDVQAAERARENGVAVRALSSYFAAGPKRQGIVLGYAGFSDDQIVSGAKTLAKVLRN